MKVKRLLSSIIALAMLLCSVGVPAFAAETGVSAEYTCNSTYASAVSAVKGAEEFVSVNNPTIYRDGTKLLSSKMNDKAVKITAIKYRAAGSTGEYTPVPDNWIINKTDSYFYYATANIDCGSYDIEITFDFTAVFNNGTDDTTDDENISFSNLTAVTTLDVFADISASTDALVLEVSDITASYTEIGQTALSFPFKATCGADDVSGIVAVYWELTEGVTMKDTAPSKQSDGSYTFGSFYPYANSICQTVPIKAWAVYGHYDYEQSSELIIDKQSEAVIFNVTMTDCETMFAARIGSTGYSALSDAFDAALDGETVTVLNNADISETGLVINTNVILDLNGNSIKAANTASGCIYVNTTGKLTLTDSAADSSGRIYTETDYDNTVDTAYGVINVSGEFVMESGCIYAVRPNTVQKGQFGVYVTEGGKVTVNGGKIEAGWYTVGGNGNDQTATAQIVINGGELVSTIDYAIYQPNNGTLTVNGGTIYGAAGGIAANSGTVNITGGLITSKGQGDTGEWGDGTGGIGNAALNVNAEYGNVSVTITGGTLTAEGDAVTIAAGTTYAANIAISGGSFSSVVDEAYCAEGYTPVTAADPTTGMYTVEKEKEAKVIHADGTEKTYETLDAAIADAAEGETVALLKDIERGTTQVTIDKAIKLDLNGHVLSGSVTGSTTKALLYCTADVTITDTGAVKGKISNTLTTNSVSYAVLTKAGLIVDGAVIEANYNYTGTTTKTAAAVYVYGTSAVHGWAVIKDSVITANSTKNAKAVYVNSYVDRVTISGSVINNSGKSSSSSIYAIDLGKASDLTVTDTTINVTGESTIYALKIPNSWTKTCTMTGCAINMTTAAGTNAYIIENGAASYPITLTDGTYTVTDGTPQITGAYAAGGRYSFQVADEDCAAGKICSATKDAEGYYTIVDLTEEAAVAKVENSDGTVIYYSTFYNAVNGNKDNKCTITLLKDDTENSSKNILAYDVQTLVINEGCTLTSYQFNAAHGVNNGTINAGSNISLADFTNNGTINCAYTGTSARTVTVNSNVINNGSITGQSAYTMTVNEAVTGTSPYVADTYTWDSTTSTWLSNSVAEIVSGGVTTRYATLAAAITAAQTGDTVTLIKDIDLGTSRIDIAKEMTIDLNGHSITGSYESDTGTTILVTGADANLTLKDSVGGGAVIATATNAMWVMDGGKLTVESGTVKSTSANSNNAGIRVSDSNGSQGTVVINGGTVSGPAGIFVQTGGSLTVTGGEVTGTTYYGIVGNGTDSGTTVTISGGTVTGEVTGIFHPQQDSVLTISDSAVISGGATGIEMRAGTLNVTGGTVTGNTSGNYASVTAEANANGITTYGAGIAVSQHTTNRDLTVNISDAAVVSGDVAVYEIDTVDTAHDNVTLNIAGGTFTGTTGQDAIYSADCTGFVSGGSFSSVVDAAYCAEGYVPTTEAVDGMYTVKAAPVASVTSADGTVANYYDLQTAINEADGKTVTLLADVALGQSQLIVSGVTTTLDLNGFTLSSEKYSTSSASENYLGAIEVETGGDLTIKDSSEAQTGTVAGAMFVLLLKGGSLTVEGGTFTFIEEYIDYYWEALLVGAGSATINGGDFIGTVEQYGIYGDTAGTLTIKGGRYYSYPINVEPEGFAVLAPIVRTEGDNISEWLNYIAYPTYEEFAAANSAFSYDAGTNTLSMASDHEVTAGGFWFNKTVNFDLCGHTLQYTGTLDNASDAAFIVVNGGVDLHISDSVGNGTIKTPVQSVVDTMGNLYLHSGVLETTANGATAVVVDEGGALYMDGGEIKSSYICVKDSTYNVTDNPVATINITGGTLTASSYCVRITARASASGTLSASTTNCVIGGDAVLNSNSYAVSMASASANSSIEITGGTINGNVSKISSAPEGSLIVSGGVFDRDVDAAYIAAGSQSVVYNEENGTYIVVSDKFVAKVTSADGTVTMYETLQEAINAAQTGEKVTVLKDVDSADYVVVRNSIILELNGNTVSSSNSYATILTLGGDLTVQDSSEAQTGKIYNSADKGYAVWVYSGGKMTLTSGSIEAAAGECVVLGTSASTSGSMVMNGGSVKGTYGILVYGNSSLTVNSGSVEGTTNAGIVGYGSDNDGTTITVTGGTVAGVANGIYHPQDGVLTVTGGTVTGGSTGIEMRAGTLNMTGGTVTGNADGTYSEVTVVANGSGSTTAGAGIAVAQHTTKKAISVNISGDAVVEGVVAVYESNPQGNSAEDVAKVSVAITDGTFTGTSATQGAIYSDDCTGFVSGGSFSSVVDASYCAEGFVPVTTQDENGMYTVKPAENRYTVTIDGVIYWAGTDGSFTREAVEGVVAYSEAYSTGEIVLYPTQDDGTLKIYGVDHDMTLMPEKLGADIVTGAQIRIGAGVKEYTDTNGNSLGYKINDEADAATLAGSGLRFIGLINMGEGIALYGIPNSDAAAKLSGATVETGIEIAPSDAPESKVQIPAVKFQNDTGVFSAALVNLKAGNYNRVFTAKPYVTLKVGSTNYTYYGSEVSRSIYEIAAGMLVENTIEGGDQVAVTINDTVMTVLNAYVNQVGIRLELTQTGSAQPIDVRSSGKNGAYVGGKTDEYGSKVEPQIFFNVTSENVDGIYNVTIAPKGSAKIFGYWDEYIRLNNQSLSKYITSSELSGDGTSLTLTIDPTNGSSSSAAAE